MDKITTTIKREWLEKIANQTKRVEYREIKPSRDPQELCEPPAGSLSFWKEFRKKFRLLVESFAIRKIRPVYLLRSLIVAAGYQAAKDRPKTKLKIRNA